MDGQADSGRTGKLFSPDATPASIARSTALAAVAFALLAVAVYQPALDGEFVSDDLHYVAANGYVTDPSPAHLLAILDPTGPLIRIVENYAPVHLLLHAAAWQLFGAEVRGHHLLTLLLHALASALFLVLLRVHGATPVAATLGATFFLLHPANVEAVAWISQLKTTSAMVLLLGALLAHPRWPGAGLLLFALALLAKPTAAVGLFVVAGLGACRSVGPPAPGDANATGAPRDWQWRWVGGWAAVLVAFAAFELLAFAQTAGDHVAQVPQLDARIRTIFAVALRYLVMAGSGYGISVFHEPAPSGWLDPWWLAALPVLGAVGWRLLVTARARETEAVFWAWAIVSFAPVSGVIPLPHVLADRYLYFMLPGLIGAVLLGGPRWLARGFEALGRPRPARLGPVLALLAVVWIGALGTRSHARCFVWQNEGTITADLLRNYPEGRWALVERAARAARRGQPEDAVALLERAHAKGFTKLDVLLRPRYAGLRGNAGFDRLLVASAQRWIDRVESIDEPNQSDLMVLAQAHIVRGELSAARSSLERAIAAGGPQTEQLVQGLEQLSRLEQSAPSGP